MTGPGPELSNTSALSLPDDMLGDLSDRIERATGFVIEPSHVAINGTCADCAN